MTARTRRPRAFPIYQSNLGLSIGQAEVQTGIPAHTIKRLIAEGHIATASDGSIPSSEISRLRRDRPDLLDVL
ncbi:hypothetical protein [Aeromicrobium alkaliterrae]|uniref:DNA-binding protein n=1 Tax=Aeromicrobium alkaliterrae TaxID=302168 RepID=A0ABN2JSK0_9ACTN